MEKIKPVSLTKRLFSSIKQYGIAVNEERAIPDYYDGLKPVQRKVLWSMHQMGLEANRLVKTARVVGDVLGKFHPHGDKSVQDAITTLVQQVQAPVFGEGNWGSITGDKEAAMRYTLVRLSEYGKSFFDPFYLPVLDLVPNYDGSTAEPVRLTPMLPHLLLNGSSGIGVGATVEIPAFTKDSVKKVLEQVFAAGKCTVDICSNLEIVTPSNARVLPQKKALTEFYASRAGSVKFASRLRVIGENVVLTGVAPFQGVDAYMKQIFGCESLAAVARIQDMSSQWELSVVFTPRRGVSAEALKDELDKRLTSVKHYKVNITKRTLIVKKDGWREVNVEFQASSIVDIFNRWFTDRVELEKKALSWQLEQLNAQIRRNEVLILAGKFVDFLFTLAKSKKTNEQCLRDIEKQLGVSRKEAEFVFELKWRQLRSIEVSAIGEKIKEQKSKKAEWEKRYKNPVPFLISQLKVL